MTTPKKQKTVKSEKFPEIKGKERRPVYQKICFGLAVVWILSVFCTVSYAENRESPVVKAVQKVGAAVVNISSEYEVYSRAHPFFGADPFFDSFFRDFFDRRLERREKKNSLGSGVIIDGTRGFILTNEHVIAKTGTITVVLKDEREFEAQIVGSDPDSDLAVLRISSDAKLPAVEMGNSDDLMIGETVIAIGNPFGFSHTVTTGVISAVGRSIRAEDRVYHEFIQTDASINPGNSGGPLLNINGELIGINTAIYAKAQGIGFAIPISRAKRIVSDLIHHGEVVPAWIGLTVQDVDARLAQYLQLPGNKGVLVKRVVQKSPADRAGIQDGDIILSLDKNDVRSEDEYYALIKGVAAGDSINMEVWRSGKTVKISLKSQVFPIEQAMDLAYSLMGIKVEDISEAKRYHYRFTATEGVMISELHSESYLASIGARPGDVIRKIDDMTIYNLRDFEKAIVKCHKKSSVVILLQRGDQGYYITVRL
jgi:Do/DeqQ family serine protease